MSAQAYYRDRSPSPPRTPPSDDAESDEGSFHDRYNTTGAGGRTSVAPERVTSPNQPDTLLSHSLQRNHSRSGYSDTSEYGRTHDEEGGNPYGQNHSMADEQSKEALVRRRSSGYQDLGMYFPTFFILTCAPTFGGL